MADRTEFRYPGMKSRVLETSEQLATELTLDRLKDIVEQTVTPTVLNDGTKTVTTAGTSVCLVAAPVMCREVLITARPANTGFIYLGSAAVSSSRYFKRLNPGESIGVAIDNLAKLYLDSSVSGDSVLYGYVR